MDENQNQTQSEVENTNDSSITETLFSDDTSSRRPTIPVPQQLTVLALLMLIVFGSGVVTKIVGYLNQDEAPQTANVPNSASVNDVTNETETIRPDTVVIQAKSAFVWDVNQQRVLFAKNPDEQLPLASLTKLMTALVAHEIVNDNTTVPISMSAIQQDGESGLSDGEKFSLSNLLDLTLISSSNDGAFAIASAAGALLNKKAPAETFVQAMNIRADELGLNQTYFRNPTGLDVSETEAGAYGSARDITFLMEYILKHYPNILEYTTKSETTVKNEAGLTHVVANTNQTVDNIPGLIGSKTGYTTLAGGNLTIAFDASLNRPIIVVALGSTHNGRFSDVLKLSELARQLIQ